MTNSKIKRTEEEVSEINQKIRETNIAKIEAMPDLDGIRLTRIRFDHESCQHDKISSNKYYLVLMNGHWWLGQFTEQWYGWNFTGCGGAGCQLDHLQMVYETDLERPDLKLEPYVKFEQFECSWCNAMLPEDKDEWCGDDGVPICYDCWMETC